MIEMNPVDIAALLLAAATVVRVIVRLTPTKKDDNILIRILKIVEALGVPDIMAPGVKVKIVKSRK